uniref:Reverse transcriptase domain-containing protein n=1 Tax=Gouania willdenowi TaxID=441366 RepID=A0A8C5HT91_GOUWI
MGTAEQRISDLEDTSAATAPRVKALEGELQKALDRLENFENQSRRQNLRIVGLNEGSEGRTPVEFFEKWIPDVLGMQTDRIKLDRAHRTGPPTRLSGKEGPRAVLVRLHDYTNKQKILQAARNRGTLSIDGSNVSFYQDFSVEVVRRRKESANARKQLREAGIRYSFLYPAVIKVFHPDGTKINDKNGADPRIVWDTYKAYMRGMIISYTSRRKKERAAKQLEIENKVKLLEETYYKTRSEATLIELKSTRTVLNNLITRKAERDILFTKQNFFELANKPNRLLARLARNAPIKSYISAVQDENQQRQTNNRQINESFKRFYTKLYSSEIDKERLGKDQFDRLESPISILEIDKAISTLQSGKCPGEDGFPVEFFKVMKGKINKLLLRVFDKSLEESVLPESMYGANITLIVKKNRNPELCSSYRPISLLNVDNKILSKILALRLENVVNTIVDADQTGFICGRNSYHNTRRLLHIIHHLNTNKTLGAVVSMDAEKAFDRIEWEYMFEVMKRFGFGCGFLRWVRLLYKAPTASVLTNGLLSAPFKVKRGTAQGSPLSPTLFALAIEPLALAIRQNPDIQGVTIGTKQHKILLYADDILLTLTKPSQSLIALTTCLREFSLISGYKVNFDKSEIMILDNDIKIEPPYIQPFRWAPSGFDYLGIRIVPQLNRLYSENITPLVKKVQEMLTRWKNLPVSFLGRINLIKMTVLPKILYPTSMLFVNLSANDIANMNKALSDFIWNGRKPKVKLAGLQLPREQGGWGLPNIEYYVLSLQARIISDNPLITHVLWAWKKCVKIFNNTHPLSLLMTLVDNTELSPQGTGSNFTPWRKVGIVRILDLFENGKFKTFESLKDQCKQQKHFISKFYSEILSLNLSKLSCLRTSWCTLLKCVIDDDVWDEILRLPSRISICNRYKELQYKILHHIYISPQIYSKYRTGTSPNCPKCKSCIGTRFHCLWECKKVQTFWRAVCLSVSKATGQQVSVDPLMCLLGKIPASLKNNENVIQSLLMLARKAIMVKWVGEDPPSISVWKSLISEVVTLEKLGHCINGRTHLFLIYKKKNYYCITVKDSKRIKLL